MRIKQLLLVAVVATLSGQLSLPARATVPDEVPGLDAVRVANPWLMPSESGLEICVQRIGERSVPVIEDLGITRDMGMTFRPASLRLFHPLMRYPLEWVEDDTGRALELKQDTGYMPRADFGLGPVGGGTWHGYWTVGGVRWRAEFDSDGRIIAEKYFSRDEESDSGERLSTTVTYTYDSAFSPSYPCRAIVETIRKDHALKLKVEFQFITSRWMVKRGTYFFNGEPVSILTICPKVYF